MVKPSPRLLLAILGLSILVPLLAVAPPATADTRPPASTYLRPPDRNADFPRLPDACYNDDGSLSYKPCRLRTYDGKRPTLVLWGDSHSWEYVPAVRQQATRRKVNLILLLHGSCPPSMRLPRSVDPRNSSCDKANDRNRDFVERLHERKGHVKVLISAFWAGYRTDYRKMQREAAGGPESGVDAFHQHMARLAVLGSPDLFTWLGRRRVDVDAIGQSGTVPASPRLCDAGREPYQCDLPRDRALPREQGNREWLRDRLREIPGRPMLVDATGAYCDATTCFSHVNGTNTWYDDLHLAAGLTQQMGPYFDPVFDDLMERFRG